MDELLGNFVFSTVDGGMKLKPTLNHQSAEETIKLHSDETRTKQG